MMVRILFRLLNLVQEEQKQDFLEFVEEKFVRRLTQAISGVKEEISGVNERITTEIASVRVDMHRIQSNIIKWMFIFLVGQFGAIMGFLFLFFK